MWTVAVWIIIAFIAINGMFIFMASAIPSFALVSPFTNSTITPVSQPDVTALNSTLSPGSTAVNATGGDSISIWDQINFGWNITILLFNVLTGGFLFGALTVIGMPTLAIGIFQTIIVIFMGITASHFWRGIP